MRRGLVVLAGLILLLVAIVWMRPRGESVEGATRVRKIAASSDASRALATNSAESNAGTRTRTPAAAAATITIAPGAALPPPGTPLMAMFESLKKLADAGDARAACRIAFELDRCRKIDVLRRAPSFFRDAAKSAPVPQKAQETTRFVSEIERRLAQAETACKDFPQDQTLAAWDYGLAAALAGNREARWLVSFFPAGLDYEHPENTLEGWAEWRRYIARILEEGVAAGDPRIVSLAARAYHLPSLGYRIYPPDPVRAAALQMSLETGVSSTYRPRLQRDIEWLVTQHLQLDEDQQRRARNLASTLPPLTQLPAGGFDWSRGMAPDDDGTECERP